MELNLNSNALSQAPVSEGKSLFHALNNGFVKAEGMNVRAYSALADTANSTSGVAVVESIKEGVFVAYLSAVLEGTDLFFSVTKIADLNEVVSHPQFMSLDDKQQWSCLWSLASQLTALDSGERQQYVALLHALTYIAHNTTDDGTDVYDAARSYARTAAAVILDEELVICAALDYTQATRYDPDAPEHGIYVRVGSGFQEVVALSEYETLLRLADGTYLPTACSQLYEDSILSPFNDCLRSLPEFDVHEAYGATFQLTDEQHIIVGDQAQMLAPEYSVTRDGDVYTIGMYSEVDSLDLADHFYLAE